jgi:PAS domain S-box-containing protein
VRSDSVLRFLVVEDGSVSNQLISNQLERLGHRVVGQAFNGPGGVDQTERLSPDVVLMDLQMVNPETGREDPRAGIQAAQAIQRRSPTPVVVLTAHEAPELIREATEAGIGAYLLKPPDPQEIERAARVAIARFEDMQALRRLNRQLRSEMAEREQAEEALQRLEWMLTKSVQPTASRTYDAPYDDPTELNTCRVILDAVGETTLRQIAEDAVDLLDTSVAVYERNGDYACGLFSSAWCQFMDSASYRLCGDDVSTEEALACGRWLCHENCWNDSAQAAMASEQATDIACVGGIHLYGAPIFAGDEVIGAINIGYGNPPTDEQTCATLAEQFGVRAADLQAQAEAYEPRPSYIIDIAKKRLHTAAALIGQIVERERAEQALRESKALLSKAEEMAHLGSWEWDLERDVLTLSDEWQRIHGYNAAQLRREELLPIAHPEDQARIERALERALERDEPYEIEHRIIRQDNGEVRIVEAYGRVVRDKAGRPIEMYGTGQDITERKRAEEKLQEYANRLEQMVEEKVRQLEQERAKAIQLDKLAALGEMATGIAHELRQPLTAIGFEADYLALLGNRAQDEHGGDLSALLDPAGASEIAEGLKEDLARCRRLIDHLRDFGRVSDEPPEPICLNDPIEDGLILVGARLHNRGVDVHLDLVDDLPPILAHPNRLEQVFLNLVSNAEHAMERKAAEQATYQKVLELTTIATGDEVIATVRDNGCGIPEDVRERIFDPFFTTKPRGEGTGLGLSISHGIVTGYGGEITCHSVEGQGTTFTLRFPAVEVGEKDQHS